MRPAAAGGAQKARRGLGMRLTASHTIHDALSTQNAHVRVAGNHTQQ